MKRVVIFGCGACGRSTLALRLDEAIGLPAIELDKIFWPRRNNAKVQKMAKKRGWKVQVSCKPR